MAKTLMQVKKISIIFKTTRAGAVWFPSAGLGGEGACAHG
jgi:hypothetical protein